MSYRVCTAAPDIRYKNPQALPAAVAAAAATQRFAKE
jgi:hypothetical protein